MLESRNIEWEINAKLENGNFECVIDAKLENRKLEWVIDAKLENRKVECVITANLENWNLEGLFSATLNYKLLEQATKAIFGIENFNNITRILIDCKLKLELRTNNTFRKFNSPNHHKKHIAGAQKCCFKVVNHILTKYDS